MARKALLRTIIANHPAEIIAMDILGSFPESDGKNSYNIILVVAD